MQVPDFDDIVFEKLNKEYGAYFLRKGYNRVVMISIVVACFLGSVLVLIPFLSREEEKSDQIYAFRFATVENIGAPGDPLFSPPPPPSPVSSAGQNVVRRITEENKYLAPEVLDTVILPDKIPVSNADTLSVTTADGGVSDDSGDGIGIFSEEGGGGGGIDGIGLYSAVEVMPKFKGGDIEKFREWVQKNTRYPKLAAVNNIQGKVYVFFIVENDGSVSNVKLVKGVDPLINDEALRAVRLSPKWTPGRHRGAAVRVSYLIMLNFQL